MYAIIQRSTKCIDNSEVINIIGVGNSEDQARINAFAYVSCNNGDGVYAGGETIKVSAHFKTMFDADSDDDAWEGALSKHQALLNAYNHTFVRDGELDYVENRYTTPRAEAVA